MNCDGVQKSHIGVQSSHSGDQSITVSWGPIWIQRTKNFEIHLANNKNRDFIILKDVAFLPTLVDCGISPSVSDGIMSFKMAIVVRCASVSNSGGAVIIISDGYWIRTIVGVATCCRRRQIAIGRGGQRS